MDFGFDLNPSGDIGFQGQNAHSITNHTSRAILFVFKPYTNQFGDIGMRPFQYQFDENFLADTQEINDLTKRGAVGHGTLLNNFMTRTNFSNHMTVSQEPTMKFNASRLSDRYRFILVLTEKANGLIDGNTLAANLGSNQIRRIYTGYFEDEPFNPATLTDTSRSYNPHAFMVITHKTVLGTSVSSGMYGSSTKINTRNSEEIINPMISQAFTSFSGHDNSLHLMTPQNIISSFDTTSDGFTAFAPGVTKFASNDAAEKMPDTYEQPTHNVATIVKGMMRYQDDVSTRGRLMTSAVDNYYANDFLEDDANRLNLARFMSIPQSKNISKFDLDIHTRYSGGDIQTLVGGDLDVVNIDQPRPMYYDTADQFQQDMISQYSYLIASVVPPILSSAGVNSMQFVYQAKMQSGQFMEQFQTVALEPHWTLSHQDHMLTAKAVEIELINGIFSTIFHSKGAFSVEVTANTTGMTVVRLNLIDQNRLCHRDFEVPSCLGGLISPVLGDSRNNSLNQEAITGLYAAATGTHSGTEGFNQDDRDFLDFASNHYPKDLITSSAHYPDIQSD